MWGWPVSGVEGKYLLTGLALCGCCASALEVRTRSHGKRRVAYYGCRAHWRSGESVCANNLEISIDVADAAALETIDDCLLDDGVLIEVIDGVVAKLTPPASELADRLKAINASWH
jgi:hypothetical protein